MPLLTEIRPRPARRAAAAGFVCLCSSILMTAGIASAQAPAYRWEPAGIQVVGGGSLPFYGGLGSGDRGPRVRLADLDDDGDLDLYALDKDGHILTYENVGTAQSPVFVPAGTDLLGLLLNDWFLFDDLDSDGDLDILGGTAPQGEAIGFFRNVGSPGAAVFSYEANAAFLDSVQVIPRLGNTPVLADFDGDGDHDIFYMMPDQGIGAYHQNAGTPTAPAFRSQIIDYGGLNTFISGRASRAPSWGPETPSNEALHGASIPLLFDTDSDGDQDLLIGDQFNPNVWCFANDGGTDSAEFRFVTQSLLDLPVDSIPLYLIGCEAGDLDADGLRDLLVAPVMEGRLARDIYLYKNVGSPDSAVFSFASDTLLSGIDLGARAYPALGDIDADGDLDMVVSHVANAGEPGLVFFENIGTAAAPAFRRVTEPNPFDAVVTDSLDTPSPAFADMDGDLDLDLLVGQGGGLRQVLYFENVGTPSAANFVYMGNLLDPIRTNFRHRPDTYAAPTVGDLDRDGDLDLLVGEFGSSGRPQMYWYRNLGSPSASAGAPLFEWVTSNVDSAFGFDTVADSVHGYLVPLLIDRNNDGYLDIVIGSEDGRLREYRSHGAGDSLHFDRVVTAFEGVDVGRASAPAIADIDGDGDRDVIVGEENGGLNLYFYDAGAPPSVLGFTATVDDTLADLTWDAVPPDEATFHLARSEEGGPPESVTPGLISGGPSFAISDGGVFPGNAYSYQLEASFVNAPDSTYGPVAAVLPIPPFSLVSASVIPVDSGGVDVSWAVTRSFPGLAFRLSRLVVGDTVFVVVPGADSLAVGAGGTAYDPGGSFESIYRLEGLYRKQGTYAVVPDSIFPPAVFTGRPTVLGFAAAPDDTTITVEWRAIGDSASTFRLSRSEEGGPFVPTVPDSFSGGSRFQFTDRGVFPGNAYGYSLDASFPDSTMTFGPVAAELAIPALSLVSSNVLPGVGGSGAQVSWSVSRSFPGLAFRLSRQVAGGSFVQIVGAESLSVGADGAYFDPDGRAGSAYRLEGLYRKQGVLTSIPDSIFSPSLIAAALPVSFQAFPARPNPSGGGPVEFVFDLPQDGVARVVIFDVSGRRVAEVGPAPQPAGVDRSLTWDGRSSEGDQVTAGLYFYRLTVGTFSQTGRFVRFR